VNDREQPQTDAMRRQLLAHMRSLRGAGVEWLPMPSPDAPAPVARSSAATPSDMPAQDRALTETSAAPGMVPQGTANEGIESGGLTLDERRSALQVLAGEVKICTRCAELCSTRTQTVFGQGELNVDICFIGEAPGADEDAQGVPFVGAAGQLLNKIIAACGLKREEVYICNILKCRPPGNRTPLPNEAANCRGYLDRQLALVQPKYIVALGGCAASNLLNTTLAIGKLRGRFHKYGEIDVLVTYHPAYLLPHRAPQKKREVWEDMKLLLTKMGRPIPSGGSAEKAN